jgi:hypothetical protein
MHMLREIILLRESCSFYIGVVLAECIYQKGGLYIHAKILLMMHPFVRFWALL